MAGGRRYVSRTHVGRVRQINQDAVHCDAGLFLVADGMGGHRGGEVASAVTVEVVAGRAPATVDELTAAIQAANDEVLRQGELDPELFGMGTTVVAAIPLDDRSFALANVGDSRAYLLRGGELRQISVDHNRVSELLDQGLISAAEARVHPERNIITRALGVERDLDVDTWILDVAPGDRLLLCSDGLVNEVTDTVIEGILRRLADPEQAADELLRLALEHGGRDNVSLVVVEEPGDGGGWDERVVEPDPLEWEVRPAPPPPPSPPVDAAIAARAEDHDAQRRLRDRADPRARDRGRPRGRVRPRLVPRGVLGRPGHHLPGASRHGAVVRPDGRRVHLAHP